MKQKLFKLIRRMSTDISPKLNTRLCYFVKFKKNIDLDFPRTFNEKIQWLKFNTYFNNDIVKQCADKYMVREYIKKLGMKYILNNLIGAYDNVASIPWEKLPNKYVIKFNIGCGSNFICFDNNHINKNKVSEEIEGWFKKDYWKDYSELQYRDVKPKIIVEDYLGSEDNVLPEDFKFYCFDGRAEYVMVCIGRNSKSGTIYCMYDRNWKWHKLDNSCLKDPQLCKPKKINEAFDIADKLSKGFPFVRTDLYIVNDKIYFGELTFTPCAGLDNSLLSEVDLELGSKIKL